MYLYKYWYYTIVIDMLLYYTIIINILYNILLLYFLILFKVLVI